ncbi:DUF1190 domain-containing protein [Rhodoblastus sphagnicola]
MGCAALAIAALTADARAQSPQNRLFATSASCEAARAFPAELCRHAHANALAELNEKSPRFTSRADCESHFHRCMIAGFASGRVEFQPALRGFEISALGASEPSVTPVIEKDASALDFRARTAVRADTCVSFSSREKAQARWLGIQRALAAANTTPPADAAKYFPPPDDSPVQS